MSEGTTPPSDRSGDDDTVAFGPDGQLPEPLPAPPPPGPGPSERPTEAGNGFDGAASGGPVSDQRPTPWRTRPGGAGSTPPPTLRATAPGGPSGPGAPAGPGGSGGPTPPPTPPPARGGGSSNALTFVAVGGVIVLVVVIVVMALTLGFGGDDDGDEVATSGTTTSSTSTTASTTTSTTTSTSAPTTPSTASTTVPPPAVTIIVDGRDLAPGLFCRDLEEEGASFDEALAYWLQEGRPARMDDDGNGIPCETVYPPADVEAVYGPQGLEQEGIQPGLFCRDLPPLGLDYSAAYAYWETEGRPARMDDDGNGVPCETVYPADEVQALLG